MRQTFICHSGAVEKRPFPKYTSAISQRCLCSRPFRTDSAPLRFVMQRLWGKSKNLEKGLPYFLHNEACKNGLSDSASLRIIHSAPEKELQTALMIPRREQRGLRWTHCDSSCFSPLQWKKWVLKKKRRQRERESDGGLVGVRVGEAICSLLDWYLVMAPFSAPKDSIYTLKCRKKSLKSTHMHTHSHTDTDTETHTQWIPGDSHSRDPSRPLLCFFRFLREQKNFQVYSAAIRYFSTIYLFILSDPFFGRRASHSRRVGPLLPPSSSASPTISFYSNFKRGPVWSIARYTHYPTLLSCAKNSIVRLECSPR